ncbi:hypothetical protein L873DRAFT_1808016 [Choiromyces venosus 120613-1]|uniref:Uncharacterized protein n=1 Tax=Choiromyces venosus 120613-1 TaxID=1336337 RepID=A0A3N4JK84_9PEZI|nr:hypothetical protein L873DRAFT_1808016 [Choiromyces venosus 120613-1]
MNPYNTQGPEEASNNITQRGRSRWHPYPNPLDITESSPCSMPLAATTVEPIIVMPNLDRPTAISPRATGINHLLNRNNSIIDNRPSIPLSTVTPVGIPERHYTGVLSQNLNPAMIQAPYLLLPNSLPSSEENQIPESVDRPQQEIILLFQQVNSHLDSMESRLTTFEKCLYQAPSILAREVDTFKVLKSLSQNVSDIQNTIRHTQLKVNKEENVCYFYHQLNRDFELINEN